MLTNNDIHKYFIIIPVSNSIPFVTNSSMYNNNAVFNNIGTTSKINPEIMLFTYKYNENSFKYFEDDHDVYQLINQTTFYTGICLFKNCTSFINKMFNKEENKRFFEFLLANESIVNLTVLMGKNECATYEQEVKYGNKLEFIMFLSFLLLISVIFTLQIIITLFKVCCHNKYYSHNSSLQIENQQLLLGDDFDDDEDEEESDIIFANNFGGMSGRPSNNVFGSHPIENAETTNNKEKSCSFSTVINFFNFVLSSL